MSRSRRFALVTGLSAVALAGLLFAGVNAGSVKIPLPELLGILFAEGGEGTAREVVWLIRLPRLAMAALLGGALALSGFLLQTYFANPIAGPFVLGISSGAKLAVTLVMIGLLERVGRVSSLSLVAAAFLGSLLATAAVLLMARRMRSMSSLLVAGIMIGYLCSAVTDFCITFADEADIVSLHGWSLGSFAGMDWEDVAIAFWLVTLTTAAVMTLAKPIAALRLGEEYAAGVGVPVRQLRTALILLSSLLSACVTAFAGPVSFVGIAVPQLARQALGSSEPRYAMPTTVLLGSVFCCLADLIARTAFSPTELNLSTVTAVLGAPVVIVMMLKRRER